MVQIGAKSFQLTESIYSIPHNLTDGIIVVFVKAGNRMADELEWYKEEEGMAWLDEQLAAWQAKRHQGDTCDHVAQNAAKAASAAELAAAAKAKREAHEQRAAEIAAAAKARHAADLDRKMNAKQVGCLGKVYEQWHIKLLLCCVFASACVYLRSKRWAPLLAAPLLLLERIKLVSRLLAQLKPHLLHSVCPSGRQGTAARHGEAA